MCCLFTVDNYKAENSGEWIKLLQGKSPPVTHPAETTARLTFEPSNKNQKQHQRVRLAGSWNRTGAISMVKQNQLRRPEEQRWELWDRALCTIGSET